VSEPSALGAHGRFGLGLTIVALVGVAIAAYLLAARLLGEAPMCGPVKGCDTVAASVYATILGIPVAAVGLVFSIVLVAACVLWWRRADRRALYLAYGLGLAGIVAVAYLTFLELFVIEAICIWCVSYAVTVVGGWVLAASAAWTTAD
jgi:uncharacterized membrane protein